jgi:hypothetical protein
VSFGLWGFESPFRTNNLAPGFCDRHPFCVPACVRIIINLTCPRKLYQLEVESRGFWDLLAMRLEQLTGGPVPQ